MQCRVGAAALRCYKADAPRPPKAPPLQRPPRRGAPVRRRSRPRVCPSARPAEWRCFPKAQGAGHVGLRRGGVEGAPVRRCCQTSDCGVGKRRAGGATTVMPGRPRVRTCGKRGATRGAAPGSSPPAPRASAKPVASASPRTPRLLLGRPGRAGGNCAWAALLRGGTSAAPVSQPHRSLRLLQWAKLRLGVRRRWARGRAGSTAQRN